MITKTVTVLLLLTALGCATSGMRVTPDAASGVPPSGYGARDRESFMVACLHNDLGVYYRENQDYRSSLREFNASLALAPDYPIARENRDLMKRLLSDPDGAIEACATSGVIITHEPGSEPPDGMYGARDHESFLAVCRHTEVGIYYQEHQDNQKALREFDRAIALAPDYPVALYDRGRVKRLMGDQNGALQDLTKAARQDPEYGRAFLMRALVHYDRGAFREALSDLQRVWALDPDGQYYFHLLAWLIHARLGEREVGDRDVKRHIIDADLPTPELSSWFVKQLGSYLIGSLSEEELFRSFGKYGSDGAYLMSLAYFYAGSKAAIEGRYAQATNYLNRCRATTQTDELMETTSVRYELRRLSRVGR